MRLIVITCGSKKGPKATQARYLYTGSYFKAQLDWALSIAPASRIRILSAKYGLLKLTDVITPYEKRITDDGAITAEEVAEQIPQGSIIESSAGIDYAKILRKAAELKNCELTIHFTDYPWLGPKISAIKKSTRLNRRPRQ